MNWWTDLTTQIVKDEKWVATEISRGWQLLKEVGHTIDVDIQGIFSWIQSHHQGIINVFEGALTAFQTVGSIVPGAAPAVTAATVAIDAATAAVDILSKAVVAGKTPLSTAVNAYHAVKDAETAVTAVLKQGTTKPVGT